MRKHSFSCTSSCCGGVLVLVLLFLSIIARVVICCDSHWISTSKIALHLKFSSYNVVHMLKLSFTLQNCFNLICIFTFKYSRNQVDKDSATLSVWPCFTGRLHTVDCQLRGKPTGTLFMHHTGGCGTAPTGMTYYSSSSYHSVSAQK